ncbi:MAG TPA: DUF4295 domain-containing protein [Dysgonamonadaceae bacterium]|nr:DUF4295 domain-containing protein [Dysgonamonadaceae bacterium]
MAKKSVAGFRDKTKRTGQSYTKVIKMVKSPENGAYSFIEKMIPNELVKDYLSK